jgi:APA family basic amino acid/polyamine antiporter
MSKTANNGLVRKLGLYSVIAIIIADMVGTGIFTTSGLVMENLGNPITMIILWIVGGFIALAGAFCYAELSAAMPYAGGEYLFLSRLFHPILGFLSGWVSFIVGFSAPIAATSIGIGDYLLQAFPGIADTGYFMGISGSFIIRKGIAILVILFFALIHIRGIKPGAKIHNGFTLLKIALIVGIILIGFTLGNGNMNHFTSAQSTVFDIKGLKSIGLSVMWIMFAYTGWNAAAYIGSEVKNPGKNLPKSLLVGTTLVIVIYVLLNLLFVYALSPQEMAGEISIGGLAVKSLFTDTAGRIFSLLVAIGLLSSISSLIILGPRIYYAMAREGNFFPFAARVHKKTGVPHWSIIIQVVLAILIALTGTFDEILTYMGFALGIFPILAAFGIFALRRQKKETYRMPLYPALPVFFILANVGILIFGFAERPIESSIAILTILAGIPLYFIFLRTKKLKRDR